MISDKATGQASIPLTFIALTSSDHWRSENISLLEICCRFFHILKLHLQNIKTCLQWKQSCQLRLFPLLERENVLCRRKLV